MSSAVMTSARRGVHKGIVKLRVLIHAAIRDYDDTIATTTIR